MHKVIASKEGGTQVPLEEEQIKVILKEWQENEVIAAKEAKLQARKKAYGSVEDQLDMMYHDLVNGTEKWKDHIAHVKATSKLD